MLRALKLIFLFFINLLVRFYNEIIAGVWAILFCIPIDSYLHKLFDQKETYNLGKGYWIFFFFYTIFFVCSGILVPYVKEWNVMAEIDSMYKKGQMTLLQKLKIKGVLKDVLMYKNLFSKEGLLQFIMANLFNISVIFAYFGIEELISERLEGVFSVVPFVFFVLFAFILTIESFFDSHLVHKIRNDYKTKHNIKTTRHLANKNLLTLILRNLGGGGTLSFKLSQLLVEDAIDDIYEILDISNSMDDIRVNAKSKQNIFRKNRIGRYRKMLSFNLLKKRKNKAIQAKKRKTVKFKK